MNETPLTLLSRRRRATVLLEQSGAVTTLKRSELRTYTTINRYEDIQQYAAAMPPDISEEFLRQVDKVALRDSTDQYYQNQLAILISSVGRLGLELALRFTSNGARLSTLENIDDGVYGRERFLAVSPSLYFTILDARTNLELLAYADNKA